MQSVGKMLCRMNESRAKKEKAQLQKLMHTRHYDTNTEIMREQGKKPMSAAVKKTLQDGKFIGEYAKLPTTSF